MELPAMPVLNRRRTLALLGSAGVAALWREVNLPTAQAAGPFACITAPPETEGPYFVEEMLNRADIRIDPTDGSVRPGVLLTLAITVHQVGGTGCATFPGAHVEVWHCDTGGTYSDEAANDTAGRKYLRGYQVADANGAGHFHHHLSRRVQRAYGSYSLQSTHLFRALRFTTNSPRSCTSTTPSRTRSSPSPLTRSGERETPGIRTTWSSTGHRIPTFSCSMSRRPAPVTRQPSISA